MLTAPKPGCLQPSWYSDVAPGQLQDKMHCKGGKLHFDGGMQAAAQQTDEAVLSLCM